jgi:hypothetical protein
MIDAAADPVLMRDVLLLLGQIHASLGRYGLALESLQRVLSIELSEESAVGKAELRPRPRHHVVPLVRIGARPFRGVHRTGCCRHSPISTRSVPPCSGSSPASALACSGCVSASTSSLPIRCEAYCP